MFSLQTSPLIPKKTQFCLSFRPSYENQTVLILIKFRERKQGNSIRNQSSVSSLMSFDGLICGERERKKEKESEIFSIFCHIWDKNEKTKM